MNEIYVVVATTVGGIFTYYAKKKFDAIRNKDSNAEDLQGKRLENFDEQMAIQQKLSDELVERIHTLHKMDIDILTRKIEMLTLNFEECQRALKKYMGQ